MFRRNSDGPFVNLIRCDPADMDRAVSSDGSTDSFGTLSFDPMCLITDDMTYWERLEALGDDSYDWNEGYYDPDQLNEDGGFVSFREVFKTDVNTVVVASVMCEEGHADIYRSESTDHRTDHGSQPGKAFLELGDMMTVSDLLSLGTTGLAGTSQAFRDTSNPPVSVGVVDFGPGLPIPVASHSLLQEWEVVLRILICTWGGGSGGGKRPGRSQSDI